MVEVTDTASPPIAAGIKRQWDEGGLRSSMSNWWLSHQHASAVSSALVPELLHQQKCIVRRAQTWKCTTYDTRPRSISKCVDALPRVSNNSRKRIRMLFGATTTVRYNKIQLSNSGWQPFNKSCQRRNTSQRMALWGQEDLW